MPPKRSPRSFDLEQLYEAIYDAVTQVMPCDDFIIDGYNATTNEIISLYDRERIGGRITPPSYYADHGLAGLIVHTGQSRIFNSAEEMKASGIQFVWTGEEGYTQSIVAVPSLLYGKVNGMISAQSHQPKSYKDEDRELLEMLAAHAAIALENARLFSEMQEIADKDPLTSLMLNRRKFYELAEREFARGKRYPESLSVLMMDVDHFKDFNDQFGHKVGDLILKNDRASLYAERTQCGYCRAAWRRGVHYSFPVHQCQVRGRDCGKNQEASCGNQPEGR